MNRARIRAFTRHVGLSRLSGDAGAVALGQMSALIYPIVSIPFLSRVLGTDGLGKLIFAMAIIQLVIYVVDFGFGMSALRAVSVCRNADERARVVGATLSAKLFLLACCALVLAPGVFLIPMLRTNWPLYLIGMILMLGQVAFPAWLLQGLGRMKTFAVLTASSRLVCLGALLITVRTDTDVKLAMLWQYAPLSISAILCWIYLRQVGLAQVQRVPRAEVKSTLRGSTPLFISSMATMVIGTANSIFLGALSTVQQVAFFGTTERMSNAARGVLTGIEAAMLPRMTKAENGAYGATLRRTIMSVIFGSALAAGVTLMSTASWLVPWYLGDGFDGAIPMARLLGLALCFTGISTTLTLVLVARNEFRAQSKMMVIAAGIHLVLLPIGCINFGGTGAAGALVVTEFCLAGLLTTAYFASNRRRTENSESGIDTIGSQTVGEWRS